MNAYEPNAANEPDEPDAANEPDVANELDEPDGTDELDEPDGTGSELGRYAARFAALATANQSPCERVTVFSRWGIACRDLWYFPSVLEGIGSGWTATFGLEAPSFGWGAESHALAAGTAGYLAPGLAFCGPVPVSSALTDGPGCSR